MDTSHHIDHASLLHYLTCHHALVSFDSGMYLCLAYVNGICVLLNVWNNLNTSSFHDRLLKMTHWISIRVNTTFVAVGASLTSELKSVSITCKSQSHFVWCLSVETLFCLSSKLTNNYEQAQVLTPSLPHHTYMNTLSEHIIQINSLRMPSLSLREGMQSFGMGSFQQAFPNGTFSGTCQV